METTGGGSDANIFNSVGLKAANLAVGMQNAHTTEECLDSKDLVNVVRILWDMIQMSAAEVMKS
jgi:tripeptide aminopeptidase